MKASDTQESGLKRQLWIKYVFWSKKRKTEKHEEELKSYLWLNELSSHQSLKITVVFETEIQTPWLHLKFPRAPSLLSGLEEQAGRDIKKRC